MIYREKISNMVLEAIQKKIFNGEYQEGERLVETKIAKELGVSQSPVREALRELEGMGLVENIPYRGCSVRAVNSERLQQIYAMRSLLELDAVTDAFNNFTEEDFAELDRIMESMEKDAKRDDRESMALDDLAFHRLFITVANNPIREHVWRLVGSTEWTVITISMLEEIDHFSPSHRLLAKYAKEKDEDAFRKELTRHFEDAAAVVSRHTGLGGYSDQTDHKE